MKDILLFSHPTFGVLGLLAAIWVFVEALNANGSNAGRIRSAAAITALCMALSGILGGWWYVQFYAPDKALILQGPWPWAHSFVLEVKEHAFFIALLLALYLPFAVRDNLAANRAARTMVLTVAGLVVGITLAIEGAGAIVSYGVKVALLQSGITGAE